MTAAKFCRLALPRRFQTPIRTFRHPDSGRTVTVVATNHFGTPGYYQRLQYAVAVLQQAGAAVYTEGSEAAAARGEEVAVTAEQRAALDNLTASVQAMTDMFARYGWVEQQSTFGRRDDWTYLDLSHEAYVQQAGAQAVQAEADTIAKAGHTDPRLSDATMIFKLAVGFRFLGLLPASLQSQLPANDTDAVMYDQRDKLVLDAVDATTGDLVLIWGARHLIGLATGLTERGYQHHGRDTWHTVGKLPRLTTSAWRLWRARRATTNANYTPHASSGNDASSTLTTTPIGVREDQ